MILDPLTGEWTLPGTTRDARPNEYVRGPEVRCAFCPGNEALTPPEIARVPGEGGSWRARAFANKYPAVTPPDGLHEVIVDSPGHNGEITLEGLQLWRERYAAALHFAPAAHPVLFKNVGAYAGATIRHPHTQLVVLDERPARMAAMKPICGEAQNPENVLVLETDGAWLFTRTASRFSSSLYVVPKECAPSLDRASPESWKSIGEALLRIAGGLARKDGGVPFNVVLASDPHRPLREFHWFVEVIPRYFTLAGFELATGSFIRTSSAQEAADQWRQMIAPPDGSV